VSKDEVIRNLALALKEALIWGFVENAQGPFYEVPYAIQGDLWKKTQAPDKAAAYKLITEAVEKAARTD
jgi:hypothetical protein